MDVSTINGSCNAYHVGEILIDAPAGVNFPSKINKILITHEHCDHIAGISKLDATVYASKFAIDSITGKNNNACLCNYLEMGFPKIIKSKIVSEGDRIMAGEITLTVIETPGHCKGALCFYEPDEKTLFSGDTVFPDLALPRTDLPTSNIKELAKTYEKLAKLDIETIYPGHGRIIKEKKYIEKIIGLL